MSKNIEDKAEEASRMNQKETPKFNETSWMMTAMAQCGGYGPYSSCFKSPQEYFKIFKNE